MHMAHVYHSALSLLPGSSLIGDDYAGVSRAEIIEWYLKEHEEEFSSMEAVRRARGRKTTGQQDERTTGQQQQEQRKERKRKQRKETKETKKQRIKGNKREQREQREGRQEKENKEIAQD